MKEKNFLHCALAESGGAWSQGNIDLLASMAVPNIVTGRRGSLLTGDVYRQWAFWFVESLADPLAFDKETQDYISVFKTVFSSLQSIHSATLTVPEIQQLASIAAKTIFSRISGKRAQSDRRQIPVEERALLVELAGSPPRCWICGSRFQQEVVEAFLDRRAHSPRPEPFIDILRPRGLNSRDYTIEVDHVMPLSGGGMESENLRLACGWCNAVKHSRTSLYDVTSGVKVAEKNSLGLHSLPHPFWVIRTLATVGSCEDPKGCTCSSRNSEMTVIPINANGAFNPMNLRVTCLDHDTFSTVRLQPPSMVRKLWGKAVALPSY